MRILLNVLLVVVDLAEAKDPNAAEIFRKEYQLEHLIATLHIPFIAIMNGITSKSLFFLT